MKKLLVIVVLVVTLTAVFTTPALAHGAHRRIQTNYSVCGIEDCVLTGLHYHDGKACAAHYYGDGHEYHEYCAVEECDLTGYHSHDGVYCFAHQRNDGHSYHRAGRGHH